MNATIKLEKKHFPVLIDELISIISPLYGGTFIDCTFGQGGYSEKILQNFNNKVFAIDRDIESLKISTLLKKKYGKRFSFENKLFSEIKDLKLNREDTKAIIFDLGCSILQINDPLKKLSFNSTGKLNMKMGINKLSAHEVINNFSGENLQKIFKIFGEEKFSKRISNRIILERNKYLINTEGLVRIIEQTKKGKNKINKATKVFQALRIFVNQEISQLINGLINSFNILPIGGMIVVITFHSIEDKIVKFFFKNYSENENSSRYFPNKSKNEKLFKLIKKKPIIASEREVKLNPPSRSAKLRYAIKIKDTDNFQKFLKKFEYLLNIESLYKDK